MLPAPVLSAGAELPARILALTHLALAMTLVGLATADRHPRLRLVGVLLGGGFVALAPLVAVRPLWSSAADLRDAAIYFYLQLLQSLAIPYLAAALIMELVVRSGRPPLSRALLTGAAYLVALALSIPISFNYAVAYFFLR